MEFSFNLLHHLGLASWPVHVSGLVLFYLLVSLYFCMCLCAGVVRARVRLSTEDEEMVNDSPHTGSVLSRSSKILLTRTPGVAGTSRHVAAAAAILARGL